MFRGVVRPVLRNQGRGLREQRNGKQQQDKKPPAGGTIAARYVARNRHVLNF